MAAKTPAETKGGTASRDAAKCRVCNVMTSKPRSTLSITSGSAPRLVSNQWQVESTAVCRGLSRFANISPRDNVEEGRSPRRPGAACGGRRAGCSRPCCSQDGAGAYWDADGDARCEFSFGMGRGGGKLEGREEEVRRGARGDVRRGGHGLSSFWAMPSCRLVAAVRLASHSIIIMPIVPVSPAMG